MPHATSKTFSAVQCKDKTLTLTHIASKSRRMVRNISYILLQNKVNSFNLQIIFCINILYNSVQKISVQHSMQLIGADENSVRGFKAELDSSYQECQVVHSAMFKAVLGAGSHPECQVHYLASALSASSPPHCWHSSFVPLIISPNLFYILITHQPPPPLVLTCFLTFLRPALAPRLPILSSSSRVHDFHCLPKADFQ